MLRKNKNEQNMNLGKEGDLMKYNNQFVKQVAVNARSIKNTILKTDYNVVVIPLRNLILENLDGIITCADLFQKEIYPQYFIILRSLINSVAKVVFMTFNTSTIVNWMHHDKTIYDEMEKYKQQQNKGIKPNIIQLKEFSERNEYCNHGWTRNSDIRPIFNKKQLYSYVGFDRFGDKFYEGLNYIVHSSICFINNSIYRSEETKQFLNKSIEVLAVLFNFLCRSVFDLKIIKNKNILQCKAFNTTKDIVPNIDEWWDNEIFDKREPSKYKDMQKC